MRQLQPHGTTCYMVAMGFLHPVEPQALPPVGYPINYANCIPDSAHSANCLTCYTVHTVPWTHDR